MTKSLVYFLFHGGFPASPIVLFYSALTIISQRNPIVLYYPRFGFSSPQHYAEENSTFAEQIYQRRLGISDLFHF